MKKFILFCIALLMIGVGTTQIGSTTVEAAFSKDEVVRERFALKRERLAEVVSKKIARVENSIKTKLKEQEIKKAQKQKEEAKKAAAKKVEAETKAENEAQAAAQASEQSAAAEQPADAYQQEEAAQVQEEAGAPADAVSGASANGQERGQKNREWGNQLSDPNLTPAERQGIIQEKKNYNRNNY
ncbi:hypothetical protein [Enterococcus wangshanyuanii]|uniref:Uncharacterized protein n=1 Tax=Enterococcus wangshanyuanii TaxID=2005703 RepID=A0ABQ1PA95_9ENTE|nr:hypothetical protein [Enterococcus wangshanyuanii]GGC93474.1 hypothetical protein GCM10011573_23900 [Enterococcus wangshanyuanii]